MMEKFLAAISLVAFLVLTLFTGVYIGLSQRGADSYLSKVYLGLQAAGIQEDYLDSMWWFNLWTYSEKNKDKEGVVVYEKEKTFDGYTFVVQAPEGTKANLINMDGQVVHSWQLPFSQVWDEKLPEHLAPFIKETVPERFMTWRGTHLFKNGDLLVAYDTNTSPAGYGLAKLDKDSNLIWKAPILAHHDLDVAPDGKIYALSQNISVDPMEGYERLGAPIIDDEIAVLSSDGKILKEISVLGAFKNSEYYGEILPYLNNKDRCCDIHQSNPQRGDILHANTVRYITAEKAAATRHPLFKEGDLLISLREFDIIAVLDPEAEEIIWALRGFWRTQHDPDITGAGRIVLFDNEGDQREDPKRSRIIEIDPLTTQITWSFDGTEEETFHSLIWSRVQPLPNGNVLIDSYQDGELLEVTREKEIVWKYVAPMHKVRPLDNLMYTAALHDGQRFSYDELDFLKQSGESIPVKEQKNSEEQNKEKTP